MCPAQRDTSEPLCPWLQPVERPGHPEASATKADESSLRVLKKYPNRRLYDTQSSSYITLADVKQMVMEGDAFVVRDAKSGEDLTRSILLQIILEEETGGVPIFSTQMLSQIIRFYGHAMQGMMGSLPREEPADLHRHPAAHRRAVQGPADPEGDEPRAGTQFLQGQAPAMQGLMGNYLEQSKAMFMQMQEQMATGRDAVPWHGRAAPAQALIAQPSTTGSFAPAAHGRDGALGRLLRMSVIDAVATSNSCSRMRIAASPAGDPGRHVCRCRRRGCAARCAADPSRRGRQTRPRRGFAEVQLSFTRAPSAAPRRS